jgi:hypothetical protein
MSRFSMLAEQQKSVGQLNWKPHSVGPGDYYFSKALEAF